MEDRNWYGNPHSRPGTGFAYAQRVDVARPKARDGFLCVAALVVACLLVYGRAPEGFFLADDYTILGSFWAKNSRYLLGLIASDEIHGVWNEAFVRPVRPWSLAFDRWIWGLEPRGYHLTNLVLHASTSVLIAALVLRLGGGLLSAFLASILFLLHPVNVEVATWVSGRDESLACAALLGAVACRPAAASGRRRLWLALSTSLFALSLFAKEYALLLPVAICASAWLAPPRGDSRLRALGGALSSSVPLLGVIAVFLALRFHVSGHPFGGYGDGGEAHTTFRPDLLVGSVTSFARDFITPFEARPYASATLLLGFLFATGIGREADGRSALIGFWALLWPALFLLPTHNLVYTPRHLYVSFAGIAVAFGLLLARARGRRLLGLAPVIGGVQVMVLAPPTLATVENYTRMSNRCRLALSSIEQDTRSMPRGDVLVLVGMPAHETPPWGFGWSLAEALRPPFVEEPIDSRLEVVYRKQWRPDAWAGYRRKYPGRGIHVLAWNPRFDGIELLRGAELESRDDSYP